MNDSGTTSAPKTESPAVTPLDRRTGLWRRVLRTGHARAGLALLGLVVLVVLFGHFLAPYGPSAIVGPPLAEPSVDFLLGTDVLGRDIRTRLLYGGFSLTWMSVLAMTVGVLLGSAVGLTAAYAGGAVDAMLMRAMDVLMSFPEIVFVLLFVAMLGRSPLLTSLLVGIAFVPGLSRVMRGAAGPVIESEHVLWARAVGLPARRILIREVVPSVVSPLMVEAGMRLVWAIGAVSSLSYLGFGVAPPAADWGLMVGENQDALPVAPLAVLAPVAMILVFALGGNLLAEGIARTVARTEGKQ